MAFITRLLVRFPEVQEKLREALVEVTENGTRFDFERLQRCQYLDAVIQETLRLYPPIYSFTARVARKEKVYDGLTVPEGAFVIASTNELSMNPDIFPEPEKFKPERFLPENRTSDMAFGSQVRSTCSVHGDFALGLYGKNWSGVIQGEPSVIRPVFLPYSSLSVLALGTASV